MIDREYLQSLRELHQGCRVAEIPESVFDELCRVYLAWLDAPEGYAEWDYCTDQFKVSGYDEKGEWHEHLQNELSSHAERFGDGKRVRLVEVKE